MPENRSATLPTVETPPPTGLGARLQQFVSWPQEDKGLFLSVFAFAGLFLTLLALTLAEHTPSIDAFINHAVLRGGIRAVQMFLISSFALGGVFLVFIWRQARAADHIGWFIRFVLTVFVIELFYVLYLVGFLSAGLLALALTVSVTRFAFNRGLGMFVLVLVCGGIVLLTIAQGAGVITYAPIFLADTGSIYQSPAILWTACVGLLMVLGLLFGMLDFIAARMHELSTTDELTQIANRRHFMHVFAGEYQRAARYQRGLSLLILDLDHFKRVNDQHGHLAGDAVLRQVAAVLRNERRHYDTVGRYGGEEFVILLPETNIEGAEEFAKRCLSKIGESPMLIGETRLTVTVSIGVAAYPAADARGMDALLHLADTALYQAKEAGRNRVAVSPARAMHDTPYPTAV